MSKSVSSVQNKIRNIVLEKTVCSMKQSLVLKVPRDVGLKTDHLPERMDLCIYVQLLMWVTDTGYVFGFDKNLSSSRCV